jgi:hypothetical protein
LTWAAPVQIGLDVRFGEREPGRAAVHDDAHAAAVGFTPGGDAEQVPKGVGHKNAV